MTAKQEIILEYAKRYNANVFIETGTFQGDTVAAMLHTGHFATLYSIELGTDLADQAKKRFRHVPVVGIIQGNSGVALELLLDKLTLENNPAALSVVLWLDGHWSEGVTARGDKDTPVREELAAALKHWDIVSAILIDDARLFGTDPAYPTIEEVVDQVCAAHWESEVCVNEDIIRIVFYRD